MDFRALEFSKAASAPRIKALLELPDAGGSDCREPEMAPKYVKGVYKDASRTEPITEFGYDDRGFRILKKMFVSTGDWEEWYVRDASGNIMGIYRRDLTDNKIQLAELPIYGSGKIGNAFRQPDHLNYNYELTDHLGNVRATVSKLADMGVASMEPDNDLLESQRFEEEALVTIW